MKDELKKTVDITKILIVGVVDADWDERKQHWADLTVTTRRVLNDLRCIWSAEHIKAGNHITVREWMAGDIKWARSDKETRGKRVPCPVKAWPKEIAAAVYYQLKKLHPCITLRSMDLARQNEQKVLAKVPASKSKYGRSAYARWIKVLCGDERLGGSIQPQPLFFDKRNGRLLHDEQHNWWSFNVRLERVPGDRNRGTDVVDVLKLKTSGKHLGGMRTALERIEEGIELTAPLHRILTRWRRALAKAKKDHDKPAEDRAEKRVKEAKEDLDQITLGIHEFVGSRIVREDGEWYLHLCRRFPKPERPDLDPQKVAYLSAGVERPIWLWSGGRREGLRRYSELIVHKRRGLIRWFLSSTAAFNDASNNRATHGRKRASLPLWKLKNVWNNFCKTWNRQLASEVVKVLVERGIATLVFYQPTDTWRETRCLQKAGKLPGHRDATGWQWHGLKTALQRQCDEVGIEMKPIQVGAIRLPGEDTNYLRVKAA